MKCFFFFRRLSFSSTLLYTDIFLSEKVTEKKKVFVFYFFSPSMVLLLNCQSGTPVSTGVLTIDYLMFFQMYLCGFASFVHISLIEHHLNEVKMWTDPDANQGKIPFFIIPQPDVHDCAHLLNLSGCFSSFSECTARSILCLVHILTSNKTNKQAKKTKTGAPKDEVIHTN